VIGDFPDDHPGDPPLSEAAVDAISHGLFPAYKIYCGQGHAFHWMCVFGFMGRGRINCPSCRSPPLETLEASIARVAEDIHVRLLSDSTPAPPPYPVIEEIDRRIRRWSSMSALYKETIENGTIIYVGDGRLVRAVDPDGTVAHLEGTSDKPYKARAVRPNGTVQHFEGKLNGKEHLVREVFPNGAVQHYKGERGKEHIVRVVFPDGTVDHYKGEKGKELLVYGVYHDGRVNHYGGEQDKEYLVRAVFPNGAVQHYKGEEGKEHLVRAVYPYGLVDHYEGERGEEYKVRSVFPNGAVQHYEGKRGREHPVALRH
jgi:hypothetical protein